MHIIAMTTCPDAKSAEKMSRVILEKRLAACVNAVPGLRSRYWWKGKIEEGSEVLLIMKTRKSMAERLEKAVRENHPYELCEFLVVPAGGSAGYLKWIDAETRQ